ncbi:MAG: threonine/serine exporter family protein [Clostridia bacterium]|jgi:uncharacterized membrane protein YjjP (DUF1212 family)|nr:threonine/serine exporter family protein [Clostridia bacterium]
MTQPLFAASDVLSLAMDIGKSMIRCGAEINRVEETVVRICRAYGMQRTDVFSIVSVIVATTRDPDGKEVTLSRRIYSYATNFRQLEQLNALSRRLCASPAEPASVREELDGINRDPLKLHPTVCIGNILGAAAFTVFFGGSWKDALAAAPIAVILWLVTSLVRAHGMGKLFVTALSSATAGFLAIAFVKLGLADSAGMIMIGDIMVIIPGLTLIHSVREMLCGDLMSGLLRLLESLILALAIACGFAIPILILGGG